MALKLDHYQTIKKVHWPNKVEYVTIRTALYQTAHLEDDIYKVNYGPPTFTNGQPMLAGQDYAIGYYSHLVRRYMDPYEAEGGFVFAGALDRDGEPLAVEENNLSVSNHPTLPAADTFGSDYSALGTAHNNTAPGHYMTVEGTEDYPVPGAATGTWKVGGLTSVLTGCPATGALDYYNPFYPAFMTLSPSKPVSATRVDVKSLSITPTHVIFNGISFRPMAAHCTDSVLIGLVSGFIGTIICRRNR